MFVPPIWSSTGGSGGGGGGAVSSVFSRSGAVVAESGDYTTDQVTEATNLYFTDQRARSALSTTSPLNYDSVTGLFDITQSASGVSGFLTGTDWDAFNAKVNRTGDTMSGYLLLVGDPIISSHASTKNYVDSLAQGLKWKTLVVAASTGNLVLSGAQTIDGISAIAGDRVLAKDQSTASQNGAYVVAAGAWARTTDSDTGSEMELAAYIVNGGTVNGGKAFIQTATAPITIGVTNLTFVNFLSTTYSATEQGIKLTGTQLSFSIDGTTLSQSASGAKVADGGILNLQVGAAAAIARTKFASGTANRMLINNGTGVMTDHTAQTALRVPYYDANGLPASSSASYATTGLGNFTFAGTVALGATNAGATSGLITVGGIRAYHAAGTESVYVGQSGNFANTGTRNVGVGQSVMTSVTTGSNNTSMGYAAGNAITTGGGNVNVGQVANSLITTGTYNTAVGALSGSATVPAGSNTTYVGGAAGRYQINSNQTAFGFSALQGNVTTATNTGTQNTAIGYQSLLANSSGVSNTAVGYNTATLLTSGAQNVFVGAITGQSQTTANNSTFVGYSVGNTNTGAGNTAIGSVSMQSMTTGINNVFVGLASGRYQRSDNQVGIGSSALQGSSTPANNTGTGNNALGASSLSANTSGSSNNAFGTSALSLNTTGSDNTAMGSAAGSNTTTGSQNNFFGSGAGQFQLAGIGNNAFGYRALRGNATPASNTGLYNSAFGFNSMLTNTSGSQNSGYGYSSLLFNTTGSDNVALGHNAKQENTTASNNVAVGSQSQRYWQASSGQTSVGYAALMGNSTPATNTGQSNTAVGYLASTAVTTSNQTVSLGASALSSGTSGVGGTTAIGYASLLSATSSNNTAVGENSGRTITTGNSNIFIGSGAGFNASQGSTVAGSIAIGTNAFTTASNQLVIGSNATTTKISEVYIGAGVTQTLAATGVRVQASGSSGTNLGGDTFTIAGGASTGTGTGGAIHFQTSGTGASGTTLNPLTTKVSVLPFGVIRGTALHNNISDAQGTNAQQDIRSGTYTPSLTNGVNIPTATPGPARWTRVGNVVSVSGTMDLTASIVSTNSFISISLPIASNMTSGTDLSGTAGSRSNTTTTGTIAAETVNDVAQLGYISQVIGLQSWMYTFSYEVI